MTGFLGTVITLMPAIGKLAAIWVPVVVVALVAGGSGVRHG